MQADILEVPTWTSTDYLLRGTFCPPSVLRDTLERARLEADADVALLLAADERAVLRSLTAFAPAADPRGERLVGIIRDPSPTADTRGLQDLIRPARNPEHPRKRRFPLSAPLIVEMLADLAGVHGDGDLRDWLRAEDWWPLDVPAPVASGRAAVAVLLAHPRRQRSDGKVVDPSTMTRLAEMVNATAPANVRRDTLVMNRVRDRLAWSDGDGGNLEIADVVTSLLGVAVEVTGSTAAACYLLDPAGHLRLAAAHVPHDLRGTWRYPSLIGADGDRLVSQVVSGHRTIQLPPGDPAARDLRRTNDGLGGRPAVELAIPVPGPLASPLAAAAGAISVSRIATPTDVEVEPYGSYDHALLRNVTLRVALARATSVNESATAALGLAQSSRPGTSWTSHAPSNPPVLRTEDAQVVVPSDFAEALPAIEQGLGAVAEATGSHSATFRAALPSRDTEAPHGLALIRLAAHGDQPPDRLIQRWEDGGVNWQVAESGEFELVTDVGSHRRFVAHRQGTRSELCLPVRVENRLVGVVNLESRSRDAYAGTRSAAETFAGRMGLAIADARLAISRELQRYATAIAHHGHDVSTLCRPLKKVAENLPDNVRAEVLATVATIEQRARGLRELGEPLHPVAPASIVEIVEAAVVDMKLEFVSYSGDDDRFDSHDPMVVRALEDALHNIFDNVKEYGAIEEARVLIEFGRGSWAGSDEDLITITNGSSQPLGVRTVADLYRAPTKREVEVHVADGSRKERRYVPRIGSYLAGNLARSVGGDVTACALGGSVLRTTVSVPAATASDDRGGSDRP